MNEKNLNSLLIESSEKALEGDYSGSQALLSEASERYPDNHLVHYNLGVLFLEKGEPEKAIRSLLKAEQLNKKDSDILSAAATAWRKLGSREKSQLYYEKALNHASSPQERSVIYNNTGALFFEYNDFSAAKEFFKLAVSEDTENEDARQNLLLANTYLDFIS